MHPFRFASIALLLTVALVATGCDASTTGPSNNVQNELDATIDGSDVPFTVTLTGYTESTMNVQVGGSLSGSPSRSILLSFVTDIDQGTFPRTLTDPNVEITYTVGLTPHQCSPSRQDCTVEVTSVDGDVVSGTFSATLTNPNDTTDVVSVTDGTFQAKLQRQ